MWKNCCHFAKLQVLRNSAGTDWSCIHYCKTAKSWRDYLKVISKKKKVTLLWPCTRHIQAAGTMCCCHRVLDHWRTTGYWGSCGSAGLPCYMRWPEDFPYPAQSCRKKEVVRTLPQMVKTIWKFPWCNQAVDTAQEYKRKQGIIAFLKMDLCCVT